MANIGKFIGQVKVEMKKVAWPAWVEVRGSTVVVITSVVISSRTLAMAFLLS